VSDVGVFIGVFHRGETDMRKFLILFALSASFYSPVSPLPFEGLLNLKKAVLGEGTAPAQDEAALSTQAPADA
jgi:hypothetical protein